MHQVGWDPQYIARLEIHAFSRSVQNCGQLLWNRIQDVTIDSPRSEMIHIESTGGNEACSPVYIYIYILTLLMVDNRRIS